MTIRPCEPEVRTSRAGWMATTPTDHPWRIGVVGASEEEARRRFSYAFAAWEELAGRVEEASAA